MLRAPGELLLPEPTEPPVDKALYGSFKESFLSAPEIYKDLDLNPEAKAAAVQAWRNGEEADVRPTHLDEVVLVERAEELRAFKTELLADTTIDPVVRQAYRWRVNEAIANVYMQLCSLKGDEKGYRRWGEFIYGAPKAEVYKGALDFIAHDAETLLAATDQHPAVLDAAQAVIAGIGYLRGDRELLIPDPETFAAVREDHFRLDSGYYALLFAGVDMPTSGKVTNEQGDPILQHVLKNNLKSDYEIVDAPGATWSVVHSRKVVERPASYTMLWQRFNGLGPGHEIGSHLLEYENGKRGPLRILADLGLDRTELGNEGRALIREQVVYPTFEAFAKTVRWRDVLRRDIAIAYAHGTDETPRHTQAETYEFMLAIDRMYQAKLTADDEVATDEKARTKTESLLTRIFRGGVYLKDKVYLEGNIGCWTRAKEAGPEAISNGDTGKHDIANARHISVLQHVGALPEVE